MAIAPMLTAVQHTGSQSDVMSGAFDGVISHILRDKRGGSRHGRLKRKNRLPCRWKEQYLDEETRMYSSKDFRATFGVPVGVYRLVHTNHTNTHRKHAHKTHRDIFMMYMTIF